MRKLLALLPIVAIVAIVVTGNALVASAGLPEETPPPATMGYLTLFDDDADSTSLRVALGEGATEDDPATAEEEGEVGPLQGGCTASLATIDLTNGVVTDLPAPDSEEQCAGDYAFAPDGTLYGLVSGENAEGNPVAELTTYDLATGEGTFVGAFGPFTSSIGGAGEIPLGGLTFVGDTLYVVLGADPNDPGYDASCSPGDDILYCLYRVDDPSNPGATTLIGPTGGSQQTVIPSGLAATCEGAAFGATFDQEAGTSDISSVDTTTAAYTELGSFTADHIFMGGDLDRSSTFWAIDVDFGGADEGFQLSTINTAGGTPIETHGPPITLNGSEDFFVEGLSIEPCTVEPAPIVLEPTFTG